MGRAKERRTRLGGAALISEKQFAAGYTAFWHNLLPMSEEYLRTRNRTLTDYADEIESTVSAEMRGLVNELGFRLFVKTLELSKPIKALPPAIVELCLRETVQYVRGLRETAVLTDVVPTTTILNEAKRLADNIRAFFRHARVQTRFRMRSIGVSPPFKGCGWLDECAGDFLSANVLIEVKAGDRNFRSIDIRQILIYCALNFASKSYDIVHICLLNPRLGVFLGASLERLCQELSGRTAPEILGEIVRFVSEPVDSLRLG